MKMKTKDFILGKRKRFNEDVSDIPLFSLPQIKTMGELRKHIDDVLVFYSYCADCAWMGVLENKDIEKYDNERQVGGNDIWCSNTFFICCCNKFFNISTYSDYMEFCREPKLRNTQHHIMIPNQKLLIYYHLCKGIFTNE